jgi:hypothetical protein
VTKACGATPSKGFGVRALTSEFGIDKETAYRYRHSERGKAKIGRRDVNERDLATRDEDAA